MAKSKEQPVETPEAIEAPEFDLVTAAQGGEMCGKSAGFFTARAKRGASLPEVAASAGRSVFYKRSDVESWWEIAKEEKVTRGRRSNLPDGVKSRASVMLLDEEWEAIKAVKADGVTIVDFVREVMLGLIKE